MSTRNVILENMMLTEEEIEKLGWKMLAHVTKREFVAFAEAIQQKLLEKWTTAPLPDFDLGTIMVNGKEVQLGYSSDALRGYGVAQRFTSIAEERERICNALPGGYRVDPQWVADMVRGRL
jgi:hypothetical protein